MGDRTEELKRTLDEAVAEYARKDRPGSVLSGYLLVYVLTDYSELGTGNAWYNKTSLEGQQQHTSEGLLRIGDRLLTDTWSRGLEE